MMVSDTGTVSAFSMIRVITLGGRESYRKINLGHAYCVDIAKARKMVQELRTANENANDGGLAITSVTAEFRVQL